MIMLILKFTMTGRGLPATYKSRGHGRPGVWSFTRFPKHFPFPGFVWGLLSGTSESLKAFRRLNQILIREFMRPLKTPPLLLWSNVGKIAKGTGRFTSSAEIFFVQNLIG